MEQDRIISLSVWRYVILIMEAHICTCDVSPLYNTIIMPNIYCWKTRNNVRYVMS